MSVEARGNKIILKGYVKCIPYAGDKWVLLKENREPKSLWDGVSIAEYLGKFLDKKVRIVIEEIPQE